MVSTKDRRRENRRVLAETERLQQRTAEHAARAKRLLRRHLWIVVLVATLAGAAGALLAVSAGLVENAQMLRYLDEQIEQHRQTLRELEP
ncbi:MAG: hypothetical protein OXH70_01995 [Acidobacteria bacterium]|nr:hypothetical protein [Acidobacteriota bacterium]MCY3971599.1 hypothetical protein [Acidobacteriota bacterium]